MKNGTIYKYLAYLFTSVFTLYNIIIIKTKVEYNVYGEQVTYLIPDSVIYGAFGLIVVLVFIILKSDYWKYVFAIILIAAGLKFIQFSPKTTSFMGIETTATLLLLFHSGLNLEIFNPIKRVLKKVFVLKEEPPIINESLVHHYEKTYEDKTIEELNHISESKQHSVEATEAASRLIRKTGYNNA